jgi:uncharacterized protein YdaL
MKHLLRAFALACAMLLALGFAPAQAQTTPPKALVLYDAPPGTQFEKMDLSYAIMLRNLLGHFDAQVDLVPVQNYTAGKVNNYNATFYLGSYYDNQVPVAFLQDTMSTAKTVVWFKYNLWQLAWNPAYNFTESKGINFAGLRGFDSAPSPSNRTPSSSTASSPRRT